MKYTRRVDEGIICVINTRLYDCDGDRRVLGESFCDDKPRSAPTCSLSSGINVQRPSNQ